MKFFWSETRGLKADIERHRAKEKELEAKISELEGKDDPMSIAAMRTYRRFLCQLQYSKMAVVTRLGKNK